MEPNQELLVGDGKSIERHSWETEQHFGTRAWWKIGYIGLLHVLLIVACFRFLPQYTASSSWLPRITSCRRFLLENLPYVQLTDGAKAPASNIIEYEARKDHATDHQKFSEYSGPPSSVTDEALASPVKRK